MNHHSDSGVFGFWVYIMSDCVLFAGLFATFAVLHNSTFGGPSGAQIFDLQFVLIETLILLTSSFTCGLAVVAANQNKKNLVLLALVATLCLGLAFLGMEFREFSGLVASGNSWRTSAFLSAFFTLVGTHGLHVALGLLWMLVILVHLSLKGLVEGTTRKLLYFSLFWHFLDIVWIFIFTIVYLMGVLPH